MHALEDFMRLLKFKKKKREKEKKESEDFM